MTNGSGPQDWAPSDVTQAVPDGESIQPARHRLPGAATHRPRELLGRYELLDQVGEGGMGVVYRAQAPDGQYVALKALRPYIAHDPDARARLRREVGSLRRVRAPGVAALLDADVDGPRPFLVTDFISGAPLDKVVANEGPFTGQRLADLAHGLADALGSIHRAGVIHRDLKPGNVLISRDGPVLIDFGISHVAEDSRLTMTGLVMGTPGYLSPEMIEGGDVTQAADWWGWAATLAYAASGTPPFGRGQMTAVLDRVLRGQADLSGVDERIRPLLAAALSPDPRARPGADRVLHELRVYAAGGYTTGLPVSSPAAPAGPPLVAATARMPQTVPPAPELRPAATPYVATGGYWDAGPAHPPVAAPVPAPAAPAPVSDPRIGRSARTGTLGALLVGVVALSAVLPVVGWSLLIGWIFVARWVDRSMTAVVVRRFEGGRRSTDPLVAAAFAPWHALVALVGTVLGGILPAIVGLAAAVATALGIAVATGRQPELGTPLPIAAGVLLAAVLSWWGPGGRSLRRGSRSVARVLAPEPVLAKVVVAVVLLAAVGCGAVATIHWQQSPNWWPYQQASDVPGADLIPSLPSLQ